MVKKIFTRVVVDIKSGKVIEVESFDYRGEVVECKGASESKTATALPKWLQPYAEQFMSAYQGLAFDEQGNVVSMPADLNQQIAGFNPVQETAMSNIAGMTGGMQDYANMGLGEAGKTIQGDYLSPDTNPYLRATYDRAAQALTDNYSTAVAPSMMAAAQQGGNFGGSAMNEALGMSRYDLGENLANLGTSIYGGNYAAERGNQLQTLQNLPNTMQAGYIPQQTLAGIGAQHQAQQQAEYDTGYGNALARTQYPFEVLSGFGGALGQGGMGSGSSKMRSSGGGGMFGSFLCQESYRQGRMSEEMWRADLKFGLSMPQEVRDGYSLMARPVAKWMSQSPVLSALIIPLVLLWGKEMYRQVTGEGPGSKFGRFVLAVGLPLCGWVGRNATRSETVQA